MINVTLGSPFSSDVPELIGGEWIQCHDSLVSGYSSADPEAHLRLRHAHWESIYDRTRCKESMRLPGPVNSRELFDKISDCRSADGRIRIVSQQRCRDRLFLWWILDAIRRYDNTTFKEVSYCEISTAITDVHSAEEWLASNTIALNGEDVESGANLWLAFASGCPEEVRATSASANADDFPSFGASEVRVIYRQVFPRLPFEGRVQLSEFDEVLLRSVKNSSWTNAAKIIGFVDEIQNEFGAIVVCSRLVQWADSALKAPALEFIAPDRGDSIWTHSFRLTDSGTRLLESGLSSLNEAPKFPFGGAAAYDDTTQLVNVDGELKRLSS